MDAQMSGAVNDLEPAVFMPSELARLSPAPAKSRLSMQPKNVTICLRQCCSPSVNVILLGSTAKSKMKRAVLRANPRDP
jgi:hypothetical protein